MALQFYVDPANISFEDIASVGEAWQRRGERKTEELKKKRQNYIREDFANRFSDMTPEEVQSFILKNPFMRDEIKLAMQGRKLRTEEEAKKFQKGMVDNLKVAVTDLDNESASKTLINFADTLPKGTPAREALADIAEELLSDPQKGRTHLENFYATYDEKGSKALAGITKSRQALSKLGKQMADMQKYPVGSKEYNHFKNLIYGDSEKKAATDMTSDTLTELARLYALSGQLPFKGRGENVVNANAKIVQESIRMLREQGKNAIDLIVDRKNFQALGDSLKKQENAIGLMGSFIRNINEQVVKLEETGEKLKTNFPKFVNVPIRSLSTKVVGTADRAIFETILEELTNEVGKLASGGVASVAALPEGARERWSEIADKNMSVSELIELAKEFKHLGTLRMQSAQDQSRYTMQRMQEIGIGAPPTPFFQDVEQRAQERETARLPTISTRAEYDSLEPGAEFIDPGDGKKYRKEAAPQNQSAPQGQMQTISTKAAWDALPSGAIYIDAGDGKRHRKP